MIQLKEHNEIMLYKKKFFACANVIETKVEIISVETRFQSSTIQIKLVTKVYYCDCQALVMLPTCTCFGDRCLPAQKSILIVKVRFGDSCMLPQNLCLL